MKRIPRNPEKFDVIELFDAIGQKRNFRLNDEDSEKLFLDSIQLSLARNKTPIMLYGRRVESMFGYVAAALGKSVVIKREDCGDVFLETDDAKIPDYRIVTREGEQFLIEVKNCHDTSTSAKYTLKTSYLKKLEKYASLVSLGLKVAIYWSKWNIWTLLSPDDFHYENPYHVISFADSIKKNQMAILGDFMMGTIPPLSFRIYTDPERPRKIDKNNECHFTIGQVELSCARKIITKKEEQNIALYCMLYGDWEMYKPTAVIEDGELLSIEYFAEPIEDETGQGFQIIGSMGGMISRQYNYFTAPSGQVERFTPNVEAEVLGIRIPENYKSKQLPLWQFIQQPAKN